MNLQRDIYADRLPREATRRRSNPFATRWIRPGAIPFQFAGEANSQQLVEQLARLNWNAAIVGPHGSGKSTLLATLIPELKRTSVRVELFVLHPDGCDAPRSAFKKLAGMKSASESPKLLAIDGWEQLSCWSKIRIRRAARRLQSGLLVTVHDERTATPFPVLFQTCTSLDSFQQLVDRNLPSHFGLISKSDIAETYTTSHGNVRDALFALYDLFEQRSHGSHCMAELQLDRNHL